MSSLVTMLSVHSGLREPEVWRVLLTAPVRYKHYTIPKRNKEPRSIAQPARELKLLQRIFVDLVLSKLPVHSSATAYRKGMSTRSNAAPHAGHGPIIKMDLTNFFPSIRKVDWVRYCQRHGCIEGMEEINLSANLLFHKQPGSSVLRLAIGAPSSPILSNILMFDFDQLISERVSEDHVVYTRYADDMTFSARRTGFLVNVPSVVSRTLRGMRHPRLKINNEKTTYITPKYGRSVTGLTLANDGRVTVGRDFKRQLRAAIHKASLSLMTSEQLRSLAGNLAYAKSAEPEFFNSLVIKYGEEVIKNIQRNVKFPVSPNRRPSRIIR